MNLDDQEQLIGFYKQCIICRHRGMAELSMSTGKPSWTLSIVRLGENRSYRGRGSTVANAIDSLRAAQEN